MYLPVWRSSDISLRLRSRFFSKDSIVIPSMPPLDPFLLTRPHACHRVLVSHILGNSFPLIPNPSTYVAIILFFPNQVKSTPSGGKSDKGKGRTTFAFSPNPYSLIPHFERGTRFIPLRTNRIRPFGREKSLGKIVLAEIHRPLNDKHHADGLYEEQLQSVVYRLFHKSHGNYLFEYAILLVRPI